MSTSISIDNIYDILNNSSDTFNTLCPNSIFNNQDNDSISLSDYYCIDELNLELNNIQDELLIIHINAVSLSKAENFDNIIDALSQFSAKPSLICISETKLHDSKLTYQLSTVQIPGYSFIYHNSTTSAGGTAMYISNNVR